jgi:hypothetical protein
MLCGELQIADAIAMDGWQSLLAEAKAVTWTGRSSGSIWPTQQTAAAAQQRAQQPEKSCEKCLECCRQHFSIQTVHSRT